MTDNSEFTPLKDNQYFYKKRIYDNNESNYQNNTIQSENITMIDDSNQNEYKNISIVDNLYRDNGERNRFRTLYFKKEKEYNNLLED